MFLTAHCLIGLFNITLFIANMFAEVFNILVLYHASVRKPFKTKNIIKPDFNLSEPVIFNTARQNVLIEVALMQ